MVYALALSKLERAVVDDTMQRLIGRSLTGNPPLDIADELRDLILSEVYSQRQADGL